MGLLVGAGRSRNSGNTPPSGEIPTLQQVAEKGNSTTRKISHAPGTEEGDSATVGQLGTLIEIPISVSDFDALPPEEQVKKNYVITI